MGLTALEREARGKTVLEFETSRIYNLLEDAVNLAFVKCADVEAEAIQQIKDEAQKKRAEILEAYNKDCSLSMSTLFDKHRDMPDIKIKAKYIYLASKI